MAIRTLLNTYGEEHQQKQEHQQPPIEQELIPPLIDYADNPEEDNVPPPPLDDPVPSDQKVPLPIIDNGLSKPNITAIIRECLLKQFSEEEIRENYMETHKTRYIHTSFLLDTGLLEVVLQNIKDKLPPSDHSVVRKVTTNYINYVMKIR